MKIDYTRTEDEFMERIARLAKHWGLGEPAGRVWAAILFAPRPLSQSDIAEKTGYSLSLISPNLKILEKVNLIRSIRGKGREKHYECLSTFTESFNKMIKLFLAQEIRPVIDELDKIPSTEKNPRIAGLVSEYKQIEMYVDWFDEIVSGGLIKKIMAMNSATKEKVIRLIG
jgi:DNA-binding transcriptional regulator GbsR (MarR family)